LISALCPINKLGAVGAWIKITVQPLSFSWSLLPCRLIKTALSFPQSWRRADGNCYLQDDEEVLFACALFWFSHSSLRFAIRPSLQVFIGCNNFIRIRTDPENPAGTKNVSFGCIFLRFFSPIAKRVRCSARASVWRPLTSPVGAEPNH
jgi:hypothetical protein